MNFRRLLLIGLLLLAHVLVALGFLAAARDSGLAWTGLWAVHVSQMGLLGIWLALGRLSGPWRLLVVLGGVVAWSHAVRWFLCSLGLAIHSGVPLADPSHERWIWKFLASVLVVALPLLIARAAGMRMVCIDKDATDVAAPNQRRRLRFSIGYLLGWTTALAVTLSTLQYLTSFQGLQHTFSGWAALMFDGMQATIVIAALWLVFGTWRWPARISVFLLTSVLVPLGHWWPIGMGLNKHLFVHALPYVLEATLLLGSLAVVRVAGYRLQWYRKPPAPEPSH